MTKATRRWKRDGSTNVMSLVRAVMCLKQKASSIIIRKQDEGTIKARLIRGEVLETKHAEFSIEKGAF